MGQKVHPLGFRVGITKKHQSQWFARFQKYGYSQTVFEDFMLRKTLLNLFNNFDQDKAFGNLDKKNVAITKTNKKTKATVPQKPKITQIKIERGLIPYEIGIQIHSDNCEAITQAIDNIKFSTDLVSKLQKTRKFLFTASTQLKNNNQTNSLKKSEATTNVDNSASDVVDINTTDSQKKRKITKTLLAVKGPRKTKTKALFKYGRKRKKRLPKSVFMRLRRIKRRFKKRQTLKKGYLNIISKGLLIRKKGSLIIRKVKVKSKNKNTKFLKIKTKIKPNTNVKLSQETRGLNKTSRKISSLNASASKNTSSLSVVKQRFKTRIYKKFASLFLTKLNKQFLIRLKGIMKYWHNQNNTQNKNLLVAPLGYRKKWQPTKSYDAGMFGINSTVLANSQYGLRPVEKLTKLIFVLEKKSLAKMETLRKDFITFGTISKTRAFGYYQIITFLKQLKEIVTKIKKQTVKQSNTNKSKSQSFVKAKSKKSITQRVIKNFMNLVDNNQAMSNESRKIKWITYLKNLVNKHRTENIFYYLATIADARKDLKALKRYTKQHSNFLFGINLENSKENQAALLQRVTKTLTQSSSQFDILTKNPLTSTLEQENGLGDSTAQRNSEGLTQLQKAFLTQIETQRKMYKANLALTPKISIKFFSVKTSDVLEKASIVAESIVDALEKRKAFRGVIKKAKEDLMRRSRIKGVKIQVSGRLNGAEIARSEWVRAGRVPLQTLRANIDYSYRTANTIYGIIGVKVWIFKGYSNMN
uniref:Small ribosomal subunit protein uS3c n=1 Tax=Volvulina compacta TaxID=51721 RepID=A0A6C0RVW8_9CHLO|nr:ribosomal protein S3 [Volvulina compacta]